MTTGHKSGWKSFLIVSDERTLATLDNSVHWVVLEVIVSNGHWTFIWHLGFRKWPSRISRQGQVVARGNLPSVTQMMWIPEHTKTPGYQGISWAERREPCLDHSGMAQPRPKRVPEIQFINVYWIYFCIISNKFFFSGKLGLWILVVW